MKKFIKKPRETGSVIAAEELRPSHFVEPDIPLGFLPELRISPPGIVGPIHVVDRNNVGKRITNRAKQEVIVVFSWERLHELLVRGMLVEPLFAIIELDELCTYGVTGAARVLDKTILVLPADHHDLIATQAPLQGTRTCMQYRPN